MFVSDKAETMTVLTENCIGHKYAIEFAWSDSHVVTGLLLNGTLIWNEMPDYQQKLEAKLTTKCRINGKVALSNEARQRQQGGIN